MTGILTTIVLGAMAPAVAIAQPMALTSAQLDRTTAGAVGVAASSGADAFGSAFAGAGTGATTLASSNQSGGARVGIGFGASTAHAAGCCGQGSTAGVDSAASGQGGTAFGGTLSTTINAPVAVGASTSHATIISTGLK